MSYWKNFLRILTKPMSATTDALSTLGSCVVAQVDVTSISPQTDETLSTLLV